MDYEFKERAFERKVHKDFFDYIENILRLAKALCSAKDDDVILIYLKILVL